MEKKIYKISKDLKFNNEDSTQVKRLYNSIKGIMILKTISLNGILSILEFVEENGKRVGKIDGIFTKNDSYDYYELTTDHNFKKVIIDEC